MPSNFQRVSTLAMSSVIVLEMASWIQGKVSLVNEVALLVDFMSYDVNENYDSCAALPLLFSILSVSLLPVAPRYAIRVDKYHRGILLPNLRSGGAPNDLLEEELQIIGIHKWRYTMPKIHDPPLLASAEPLHHILHHPRNRLPPTVQDPRIRIPLQRDPPSGNPDRFGRVMQPIQPHDIVPGLTQLIQRIPRALCKHRHGHDIDLQLLEPLRQPLGNMSQIRQRKVAEAGG
jgi:hypothetical protein